MKLVTAPGTKCERKIPVPNLQAARTLEAGTVTVTSMINVKGTDICWAYIFAGTPHVTRIP